MSEEALAELRYFQHSPSAKMASLPIPKQDLRNELKTIAYRVYPKGKEPMIINAATAYEAVNQCGNIQLERIERLNAYGMKLLPQTVFEQSKSDFHEVIQQLVANDEQPEYVPPAGLELLPMRHLRHPGHRAKPANDEAPVNIDSPESDATDEQPASE